MNLVLRDNIENGKFFSELISVLVMPGRRQEKNRELKRAPQPCSELADLFKKELMINLNHH